MLRHRPSDRTVIYSAFVSAANSANRDITSAYESWPKKFRTSRCKYARKSQFYAIAVAPSQSRPRSRYHCRSTTAPPDNAKRFEFLDRRGRDLFATTDSFDTGRPVFRELLRNKPKPRAITSTVLWLQRVLFVATSPRCEHAREKPARK